MRPGQLFLLTLGLVLTQIGTPAFCEPPDAGVVEKPMAGAIIGYRPTTNLRDPSDRYVPVRLADPARVQPKGERHVTETPEEQAARLAVPCQQVVYRNTCPSGCFVFIFGAQVLGPSTFGSPVAVIESFLFETLQFGDFLGCRLVATCLAVQFCHPRGANPPLP